MIGIHSNSFFSSQILNHKSWSDSFISTFPLFKLFFVNFLCKTCHSSYNLFFATAADYNYKRHFASSLLPRNSRNNDKKYCYMHKWKSHEYGERTFSMMTQRLFDYASMNFLITVDNKTFLNNYVYIKIWIKLCRKFVYAIF